MALKPHLQSLRELSGRVEIAACYTPSEERREAFGRDNPDLSITDSLERVLADRSIRSVVLLTPPTTHQDLVQRCAAAGKHVLLEKPLEVTVDRGRQAVEAMEKAGLRLGIVLQHRFRAASRRLDALMRGGELGALLSGSAYIRWWRAPEYFAQPGRGMKARDGGGVLLTQAIHTLDLFQSLTGPIARVAAFAKTSPLRRIDTEDVVCAAIGFGNGAVGAIDATTVSFPGFPERIELACENATAVPSVETLEVFWKDGRVERIEGSSAGGGGADPMAFSHEAHKAPITDFLDAVEGNRDPVVSGREALEVHRLIEALLRSSEEGRVVEVEQHRGYRDERRHPSDAASEGPGRRLRHAHALLRRAYPTAPTATMTPPVASVEDYRAVQRRRGLSRTVIVPPTTYGTDNRRTLDGIAGLGLDSTRGIAVVTDAVTERELEDLTSRGMRGALPHARGRAIGWDQLDRIAARVQGVGWQSSSSSTGASCRSARRKSGLAGTSDRPHRQASSRCRSITRPSAASSGSSRADACGSSSRP